MRIEYLRLENFAMVKSGMGLTKFELDFKKFHKNVITLIVGNNGTGKTGGVLSNLHPFAGLGHLEARDDSDMIIPEKDGHKIIIFTNKKHTYYIEHFYAYQGKKRSRKISSYCKKDGTEMNPSGSVTAFNRMIEAEFQIDINFLKLMRLGPNVKNFIALGATERKTFLAKLLEAVEIYMADQKAAAEKSSLLHHALKIAIDKKKRLGIEDITTLKDSIQCKQKNLTHLKEQKENQIKAFFAYKGSVDTKRFIQFDQELKRVNTEIYNVKYALERLKKPKYTHIELSEEENTATYYNKQLHMYHEERMQYASQLAACQTKLSAMQETYRALEKELSEVIDTMQITELQDMITDLQAKISYYESNFKESEVPSMTKAELSADVDKMNMILFHLDNIFRLPVYTLSYYREHYAIYEDDLNKQEAYCRKRMAEVTNELLLYQKKPKPSSMVYALFIPKECKCYAECPYYKWGNVKHNLKKNKERKAELEEEQECLEGMTQIADGIYAIRRILSMRDPKITEYHLDAAILQKVLLTGNKKLMPQPSCIQSLIEKIEYHETYVKDKQALKEAKLNLVSLQNGHSRSRKEIVNDQSKLSIQMNDQSDQISILDAKIARCNQKINATEELLRDYNDQVEYNLKSSEYRRNLADAEKKKDDLDQVKKAMDAYLEKQKTYEWNMQQLNTRIKQEEDAIYILKNKALMFQQLTDEITHTEEYYDYTELIKDAVSSKTGIPKIHIMFYCRALKAIANKIISEIYDGELILRDFEITDTKFNIPYYTKGVNVQDIRYASQAEASVATVAISFAILMQFMPKYNIMLLDEIDGPLYETNKERFFASIEGELKSIGCEQVFMITQSTMYNDYPVNLIITDPDYAVTVSNKQSVIFQR